MVTVDEYARIRLAHRDGMSIRAIARTFHHSRHKVRQILDNAEPRPYTRSQVVAAPVLGPFHGIIDEILKIDEDAPPKQRHTAMQLYRRLCAEHAYGGGYDQVRRYLARKRRRQRETFIPLCHDPGQRMEADFGFIYVDFPQGRQQVAVLNLVWSYSNCPFAIALVSQRLEAILTGMVEGFAFFGCVPREVWWDNPRTVVNELLQGRERKVHERYAALASHYTFAPLFCRPARGNEKPYVENRVYTLQRCWSTPVPRVADRAELNRYLRERCLQDRQRTTAGQAETIGQRFERDRAQAAPLPPRPFDPCIARPAKVDKYQTVRFDNNRYSVPRAYAFRVVTVKGYVDHVAVVAEGQVVAQHARCYERNQEILDPLHYLTSLERRPAALDHAGVYRGWQLPALFAELRADLEKRHGSTAGARQYIQVLGLLAEHPLERVQRAIEQNRARTWHADNIVQTTRRLAERTAAPVGALELSGQPACVRHVQVPPPDVRVFDQLLLQGDADDVCQPDFVTEDQPETVAAAGHECRV